MKNYAGLVLIGVVVVATIAVAALKFKHAQQLRETNDVQVPAEVDVGSSPSDVGAVAPSISAEPTTCKCDCKCDCAALAKQVAAVETRTNQLLVRCDQLQIQTTNLQKQVDSLQKVCQPQVKSDPAEMNSKPVKPKTLTMIYGDTCPPCQQWKVSGDRKKIEAECPLILININDADPKPDSIPAFTLEMNGLKASTRGYLTYQRFKEMEKAIENRLP